MRLSTWWDPFAELEALQRAVNRLFESFLGEGEEVSYPPVNVCDKGDVYVVKAWLPGVRREDVNLTVLGNTLTIQGEKREPDVKGNFLRKERSFGPFHKVVEFPADVDAEKVTAKYRDGILTVTLPKAETAKPRQITVETETE